MKRIALLLSAVVAVAGVVVHMAHASGHTDGEAAPIFGIKIPPGYRDWRLISVAHEEGDLNDIRAILGNDTAIWPEVIHLPELTPSQIHEYQMALGNWDAVQGLKALLNMSSELLRAASKPAKNGGDTIGHVMINANPCAIADL